LIAQVKTKSKRLIYLSVVTKTIMKNLTFRTDSQGPYELSEFRSETFPFEIGSLERQDLVHLGEWNRMQTGSSPYGLYHRLGIKDGVLDAEGDPATVFLHFAVPYSRAGHAMTPQALAELDATLDSVIKESTIRFSQEFPNTVGVRLAPPDYMLMDLVTLLHR
jgi:hypothetical protein